MDSHEGRPEGEKLAEVDDLEGEISVPPAQIGLLLLLAVILAIAFIVAANNVHTP